MSAGVVDALVSAGMREVAAQEKSRLFDVVDRQLASVDRAEPMRWFVPGRIEVLGKHTDYAGGRSLLCAVERGFPVAARPRSDAIVRIHDVVWRTHCDLVVAPDLEVTGSSWTVYPAVVARRLARDFPGVLRGADIALASDLPPAAGLSSSSALVVAIFAVLSAVNRLPERTEYAANIQTAEDLAGYLGCMENGLPYKGLPGGSGVGTFGGSEDHTAIIAGEPGHLKQYSFCPVRWERTVKVPAGCVFAIAVSGITADKIGSARSKYNRASQATRSILDVWRSSSRSDAPTLAAAATSSPDAADRIRDALRAAGVDSPWLLNRFEQFWRESEVIVPQAVDALARQDLDRFGALVDESQAAAETLLGNQVPETTWLVRHARSLGAIAASAFGAGFGGSVWALVPTHEAAAFADRWRDAYDRSSHRAARAAEFLVTAAGPAMVRL